MINKHFTIIISASALLLWSSCTRNESQKIEAPLVKTEKAIADGGRTMVTYPGRIKSGAEANAAFRVAGTISSIPVSAGQFVKAGQTIAILDDRDYRTQLEATEAEFSRISADANRVIELYKRGSASASEYDKASYGLKQITAKLEAHRNALADTRLKAPYDGYIQKKLFEPGETVGAGMPVVSLVSSRNPEIEINITATDYIRREKAISYTAMIDAIQGSELPLTMASITPKANLNQLYTMRLQFKDNKINNLLTPGMVAEVVIRYQSTNSTNVTVPLSAVKREEGKCYLWVYKDGKVTKRAVETTDITSDGRALITEGLAENEIVVTAGTQSLKEGMQVRLLPETSATNLGDLK